MENNIETTEDVKIEEVGETVATEPKVEVEMISKEDAQKMVDKALAKRLPAKEEMEAFKQWKESQKTETEKQAEIIKELETLRQEKINTQRENILLKKGVNEEDFDYIMFKVGKMEGGFEDNLVEFLKENPKFNSKEETKATTTGVKINNVESQETGVSAILKAKHPELFN